MYVCSKVNFTLDVQGIIIPKLGFAQVSEEQVLLLKKDHATVPFVKNGQLYFEKELPASFKTTAQQLSEAKQETETVIKEAKDAIAQRDSEIAELKAKLAALGSEE